MELDVLLLQDDLDALSEWSTRNALPFNFLKCKMLQLGKRHPYVYHLGPHELPCVSQEKDLGVWITECLKPSKHCLVVYNRISKLLSLLRRHLGLLS